MGKRTWSVSYTHLDVYKRQIHMTQEAEKMGVDGTLQVCPYYNKPSQDGVYAH